MSGNDEVSKMLSKWLGKAKQLGQPPPSDETKGVLQRPEIVRGTSDDAITQLNFKIPRSMKKRIKQLAARDNITLLAMLDQMLELYEKERGAL